MMVNVVRPSKLSISGSWTLSGHWVKRFREWREADMVMVSAYYPDPEEMSDYMCQFEIDSENHVMDARKQIPESGGIYQISVSIVEL